MSGGYGGDLCPPCATRVYDEAFGRARKLAASTPVGWARIRVPVVEWTSISWNGRVSPLGATITHGGKTERWNG